MITTNGYAITIIPLIDADGGGYLVEYPDLPGCMGDGETVEEAIKDGELAFLAWTKVAKEDGIAIPEPYSYLKKGNKHVSQN